MLRTGGRGVAATALGDRVASDPRRKTAPASAASLPAASLRFAILPFAVRLPVEGISPEAPLKAPDKSLGKMLEWRSPRWRGWWRAPAAPPPGGAAPTRPRPPTRRL